MAIKTESGIDTVVLCNMLLGARYKIFLSYNMVYLPH